MNVLGAFTQAMSSHEEKAMLACMSFTFFPGFRVSGYLRSCRRERPVIVVALQEENVIVSSTTRVVLCPVTSTSR
ncbi:hypothetical protein HPB47_002908 [Ixodes persulcatus]|uniref:Uncharacterized protein n=1 Tax=Ixodes persulcatus TaxID=34615 RepID=A0AC60PJU5_IXOPE|nr:hypothetical protein HPB47_002908 [Ixodes persulcatus]